MKKYMLLHYGFEPPTNEIMEAWNKWFESISDKIVDRGAHLPFGKEISKDWVKDLPLGKDSLTGYNIINAENMEEAEEIAKSNPFIASIRVYEMMEG